MNLKRFSANGYKKMEDGTLQVGDVVVVKNGFQGVYIYEIDAVTKTMAKCKCERYTQRFRLNIKRIKTLPADIWDTNDYTVYRKVSENV